MKPWLTSDPSLGDVLEELRRREPIFHRPEPGAARPDFGRTTAPEFWEVGASGRRYSREYVLRVLEERDRNPASVEDVWATSDFACRELASDVYLLTYTLLQGRRRTRRASIWRRCAKEWKIVFHQGTVVEDDTSQ